MKVKSSAKVDLHLDNGVVEQIVESTDMSVGEADQEIARIHGQLTRIRTADIQALKEKDEKRWKEKVISENKAKAKEKHK